MAWAVYRFEPGRNKALCRRFESEAEAKKYTNERNKQLEEDFMPYTVPYKYRFEYRFEGEWRS